MAQMVKNLPAMRETWDPWVGNIPWRRVLQPTPVFLPGEYPWTEEPWATGPWGHKESDMTEGLRTVIKEMQNQNATPPLHTHQNNQNEKVLIRMWRNWDSHMLLMGV